MKNIGEIIKKRRKEIGLTQAMLARKMNVTQSLISQTEKGLVKPTMTFLYKLADSLSTTPSYFFTHQEKNESALYVDDTFLAIEKAYLHYQYDYMKSLIDTAKNHPAFDNPHNQLWLMIWEAKWYYQNQDMEKGLETCFHCLDTYEDHLSRFQIGEIHRLIGDLYCGKAILLDPVNLSTKGRNEIKFLLKEALYHYSEALSCTKFQPNSSETYKKILYGMGYIYLRLGKKQESDTYFQLCLENCQKDITLANSYFGYVLEMNGKIAKEEGRLNEALDLFQKSLQRYQENEEIKNVFSSLLEIADTYDIMGEKEKAKNMYLEIKQKMANHPDHKRKEIFEIVEERLKEMTVC
ncbi:helix-turn-helix domain-containing protein [Neobacillus sp. YIM B02564]|uniref:Helix-turn-helix domain-containing protein n=1 Tax=Neobacillus paridis TaxID=2803862 RepID=A0ABS1TLB1_9BACI|nr:helix-turn-helix domain-containing protein [Neobacillus paridis]MBL4952101.1 helix-turn-helix domain-containing protein [Neobacillus paridis]